MTDFASWITNEPALRQVLPFLNLARRATAEVSRCDSLCKGLNKLFNLYADSRPVDPAAAVEKRSDSQSIRALLTGALSDETQAAFCQSTSVEALATLQPQIMDHSKLLSLRYNPSDISDRVRKSASDDHRRLANSFEHLKKNPSDAAERMSVLKKLATVIYMVRSNIMHSEKTPEGPDIEKSERDEQVCTAINAVLNDLFEFILEGPAARLAVYGTLRPDGGTNAMMLEGIAGTWIEGMAWGTVSERDGLPEYQWKFAGQRLPIVAVKVFEAAGLPARWPRLDQFEGIRYQRVLVPVQIGERCLACNIYEANMQTRS